ncbi:MAG: hypothetical protein WAW17_31335 [Rhodococcus sp. (in: high G+C Gram-positive bacteria)]
MTPRSPPYPATLTAYPVIDAFAAAGLPATDPQDRTVTADARI